MCLSDTKIDYQTLIELDETLQLNGRSLGNFPTMSYPKTSVQLHRQNKLLIVEMNYNIEILSHELDQLPLNLTSKQRNTYDTIIEAVNQSSE